MTPGDALRRIARRYMRASLVYLSLGALLGALMLWAGNDNLLFLHSHMLLVGGVLFAAYGAGYLWIAGRADATPPGDSTSEKLAAAQFWLANVGLPGMLLGSVLPVGYGLDRIGLPFGFMEAAAAILFAVVIKRQNRDVP
ncbi:MAG: hypothetical protein AB1346_01925 [Thermodesulfobacteriota bacterium]